MTIEASDDPKAGLRETAHAARAQIGTSARNEAAAAAAQHFFNSVEIPPGQAVGAYWPIRDELDTKPLLTKLVDDGHKVCLPVVLGEDDPLEFRLWEMGAPLYPAGFGTLIPADGSPVVEPEILVVPLLGFDASGTRLGYGRAYYDRTVVLYSKMPKIIGYAFASQELSDIPRAAHDVPLDMIITENGSRRFAETSN